MWVLVWLCVYLSMYLSTYLSPKLAYSYQKLPVYITTNIDTSHILGSNTFFDILRNILKCLH